MPYEADSRPGWYDPDRFTNSRAVLARGYEGSPAVVEVIAGEFSVAVALGRASDGRWATAYRTVDDDREERGWGCQAECTVSWDHNSYIERTEIDPSLRLAPLVASALWPHHRRLVRALKPCEARWLTQVSLLATAAKGPNKSVGVFYSRHSQILIYGANPGKTIPRPWLTYVLAHELGHHINSLTRRSELTRLISRAAPRARKSLGNGALSSHLARRVQRHFTKSVGSDFSNYSTRPASLCWVPGYRKLAEEVLAESFALSVVPFGRAPFTRSRRFLEKAYAPVVAKMRQQRNLPFLRERIATLR